MSDDEIKKQLLQLCDELAMDGVVGFDSSNKESLSPYGADNKGVESNSLSTVDIDASTDPHPESQPQITESTRGGALRSGSSGNLGELVESICSWNEKTRVEDGKLCSVLVAKDFARQLIKTHGP